MGAFCQERLPEERHRHRERPWAWCWHREPGPLLILSSAGKIFPRGGVGGVSGRRRREAAPCKMGAGAGKETRKLLVDIAVQGDGFRSYAHLSSPPLQHSCATLGWRNAAQALALLQHVAKRNSSPIMLAHASCKGRAFGAKSLRRQGGRMRAEVLKMRGASKRIINGIVDADGMTLLSVSADSSLLSSPPDPGAMPGGRSRAR